MKFLILMNIEWGGVMPSIPLAKALQNAGHEVMYASPPPCAAIKKFTGLEWQKVIDTLEDNALHVETIVSELVDIDPETVNLYDLTNLLLEGVTKDIKKLLELHDIDVFLLDPFLSFAALGAMQANTPTVYLKSNYRDRFNWQHPPCTSHIIPTGIFGKLKTRLAWSAKYLFGNLIVRLPIKAIRGAKKTLDHVKQEGQKFGLRTAFTDFLPEYVLPEIVLGSQSFEFTPRTDRQYLAIVDDSRADEPYTLPEHAAGKPLIYFTLGSLTAEFKKSSGHFYTFFYDTMRNRTDLHVIMQVSDTELRESLQENCPEHITIEAWVPQLSILQKADLMVTSAGLGTVKECLLYKVPMLAVPGNVFDKPGNAARIVHHKIGERTALKKPNAQDLLAKLDRLIANHDEYVSNMQSLSDDINNPANTQQAINFLTAFKRTPLAQ